MGPVIAFAHTRIFGATSRYWAIPTCNHELRRFIRSGKRAASIRRSNFTQRIGSRIRAMRLLRLSDPAPAVGPSIHRTTSSTSGISRP